nr:PREDICTED: uncharacterized protein LOC105676070 [Linepithema humile]
MSLSLTANCSFLHGRGKTAPISDEVVYATLDSLALKRTRLPLQLLPVDDSNVVDKTEKSDKEKKPISGKSPKRPSYKVKFGANHQWKSYSKYLAFSSTKSVNQSMTCATRKLDSGIKCNIENTPNEKIHTQANTIGVVEDNVEIVSSLNLSKEESRVKDFSSDKSDDLTQSQAEKNSRNDTNVTEKQCGKEKCSIKRKDSSSSSDYEQMNITDYKVSTLERTSKTEPEDSNKINPELLTHIYKIEKNIPAVSKIIGKSYSINDLTRKAATYDNSFVRYWKQDAESITSVESDDASSRHKKKRRFTKNVLHYMPRHLVKQPKKKKKLKKKYTLSSSLSSLRSLQTIPYSNSAHDSYTRTRSLSRDELKSVIISSPTNFVHVASATNPSLVQSTIGSCLEQVMITHQQICATMPLLVGKDERRKVGNKNAERPKVAVGMPPANDVVSSQREGDQSAVESVADKSNGTNYAEIKNYYSRDLQLAKVLESGQVVKTIIENQANSPDGETYEPVCESSPRALPQANSSFLWSNHLAKIFPNDKYDVIAACHDAKKNDEEDTDSEGYDDVGPSNFVAQAEFDDDNYDDVGLPMARLEVEKLAVNADCEEIYDDVMSPSFKQDSSTAVSENDYLIPETNDEVSSKEPLVELRETSKDRSATEACFAPRSDDQYFSAENNEYSSVDCESHLDEEERDELDVYDDVGPPPGEERVNSLYAGSTPGLGLTSMNGKESEWEDVEEVSSNLRYSCQTNDPCEQGTERQVSLSKKKLVQRWSRKVRRQWSRRSRKTIKGNGTRPTLDTVVDVAVSLGGGSILLIGEPGNIAGEWKSADRNDDLPRRTQGLVQLRVVNFNEDVDIQETSCYVHEDNVSDDSTYESLYSCQPDDLSSDSETETNSSIQHNVSNNSVINTSLECPTRPTPPPPREATWESAALTRYYGFVSDHYSVLADQEPLYQFYAAAVARVAFESDSEGYEEVEDMMLKTESTATNLSRSGQRMLWCHTPQVMNSDLLQKLTPEEKKIQEAKFEILTSEASYLNSLRVLENEFLNNHTLMNDILTPIERKKLFGGVPSVLSASQTFLAELEAVWREDPMLLGLSEVLLKHAEKCQATYVTYCSNQVSIDTTLKELKARKGVKFLEAIRRIEMRPACQNLSLHSFLMLPMQRVTRLPLLADAVLSKLSMGNSDRASWEMVLSTLSNVVAECNEGARAAAQEAEMEILARKLEYSSKVKPIVLRGKHLVRSGSVVQLSTKSDTEYKLTFGKKFNKTPLYLLLLTDYLLVTKLKSNAHDECYNVIDACKRNLLALEPVSEESPFAGRNAMILTLLENHSGRHVEYVFMCENNTERERWLEAVLPPKRGLVGETLYESWDCPQVMAKYLYSPNQPDELSLQPGDVINVLRKMADGWYHGEKLLDGEQGWFPANHTKEVASEHVRARNLKQRHRLLALSNSVIQQRRAKQSQGTH